MWMRLAHKCCTHHIVQYRHHSYKQKMKERKNHKQQGKPNVWSISWCFTIILWFLWTGYYVIGIYSFFFLSLPSLIPLHCLRSMVWFFELLLSTQNLLWLYIHVYVWGLYFPGNLLSISCCRFAYFCACFCGYVLSGTRSGNVKPIMFLLYRIAENWRNSVTKH